MLFSYPQQKFGHCSKIVFQLRQKALKSCNPFQEAIFYNFIVSHGSTCPQTAFCCLIHDFQIISVDVFFDAK